MMSVNRGFDVTRLYVVGCDCLLGHDKIETAHGVSRPLEQFPSKTNRRGRKDCSRVRPDYDDQVPDMCETLRDKIRRHPEREVGVVWTDRGPPSRLEKSRTKFLW